MVETTAGSQQATSGASEDQPAAPAAQGFEQLPDHLLVHILSELSLQERQHAALVCRRWHSCAHAPELCSALDVRLRLSVAREAPYFAPPRDHLPCFVAWLQRHGQPVRRLSLVICVRNEEEAFMRQMQQCMPAVAAALPQLEQLQIDHTGGSLCDVCWLGQLPRSLRELSLAVGDYHQGIELCSSLGGLTQLTKLTLAAWMILPDEAFQLPPSVRILAWNGGDDDDPLLPQLSGLTCLDTLVVGHRSALPEDEEAGRALGHLTFLEYERPELRAWMASLPNLQHLALDRQGDDNCSSATFQQQLEAGLPSLTGLTALLLATYPPMLGSVPAALAGLTRLRRLCLLSHDGPLPPGPYSASLRVLGASLRCLNGSTELLAVCGSVEHVGVLCGDCSAPGPVWQWAEQHPSLRRLQAAHEPAGREPRRHEPERPAVPLQVARLRQARPQLRVECIEWRSFVDPFKWRDPFWNDIPIWV